MSGLAQALVKEGLITRQQLKEAEYKQIGAKRPIQELLVEMGFVKEEDLMRVSAQVFNMPISDLNKETVDPAISKIISYEIAKRYGVFPVRKEGDVLILAMSDPIDVIAQDSIRNIINMEVKPIFSTKNDISASIEKYYHSDEALYDLFKNVAQDLSISLIKDNKRLEVEVDALGETDTPLVKLLNLILNDAVKTRASDIHIEPQKDAVKVRYRIDGELKNIMAISSKFHPNLVSRIKVMSDLDVAEKRKNQDGRITISTQGRNIDLRVSILPTYYGEKVVLRLLDPKEAKIRLDNLGFSEEELSLFKGALVKPQGIILVTGPTGSGKTSTLYAGLNSAKSETKNIVTIEDPIEYLIEGVNQIQLNPVKDVTFASGLRSILRQDPNVILVGEIRDKETAEIAFRASLTGHLVLSTLHTNSAVASITRLLDIGLEPYLTASSLILIVSQRLVRIICPHCKEEYMPDKEILDKLESYIKRFNINKFYKGKGCQQCGFAGFLGRSAVFEILKINEELRRLISSKASEDSITEEAKKYGLKLLAESGIGKVAAGLTSLEEVVKVIAVIEEEKTALESEGEREKTKILIADDEEDILKLLEIRLNGAGYEVVKARNGKEALGSAFKEKPDLIVMDVMMPEMDGFEATKQLRSKLQTAVIPILMLTAKKDKESELEGIDAGADDYITKPFDGDILLARIKMLLGRKV
jgi:type IV pilus assembly protein PilB